MIKAIFLLVFHPKTITNEFIENKIRIRETVFWTFIIEFLSLWVLFLNSTALNLRLVLIGTILFSIFGTYVAGFTNAFILYLLDKFIIKRISSYKNCFKLILPKIIIDVILGVIATAYSITNLELGLETKIILEILKFAYFIALLSYYLKKIYKCQATYIFFVDAVYLIFFIAPKILNNLFFSVSIP